MRALKWIGALLAIVILGGALMFFGNFFSKSDSSSSTSSSTVTKTSKSSGVSVTSMAGDDDYNTVIKNDQYVTSKARGITMSADNATTYNTMSFQSGLLDFAKDHFSTKKYVFEEGQFFTTALAQKWLARKSESNELGLNPEDNGKTDDGRAPMYLQTIEEQDFMIQSGDELQLGGIVLGIGMNTVDSYQKEAYGATFTQKISESERVAYGKTVAQEVVKRFRELKGISNTTPIYVAMYAEAPADSLVGGSFYSWASSNSATNMSAWKSLSYQNVVLPMESGTTNDQSVAEGLNTSFTNFKTKVENFLPTIASVTGQASYKDGSLTGLNVTVTTQFYSQTEVESFASFLATQAPNYLPKNVPVQIRLESSVGMQALLVKKSTETSYEVNMLGSY